MCQAILPSTVYFIKKKLKKKSSEELTEESSINFPLAGLSASCIYYIIYQLNIEIWQDINQFI